MSARRVGSRRSRPEYDVDFAYTLGGHGVGIAIYRYRSRGLFGGERETAMAFLAEGEQILVADGYPQASLDSGYHADDWSTIKAFLYDDSPEDGTIEETLDDEHPGLLEVVRKVLAEHRSHKLTLLTGRPIKVPERGSRNDVLRAGQLVRAFLGLRGEDEMGNRVVVHNKPYKAPYGTPYQGTVVYEGRSWTGEFKEWYDNYAERESAEEPFLDELSSYELAVTTP